MNKISDFLELLKAPFKILTTNGKLLAITASIYLFIYCLSYVVLVSPDLVCESASYWLCLILVCALVPRFFRLHPYAHCTSLLAVVVSVVEDTYGLSALGKAREVVKGNRVHGFLLNLLYMLLLVVIFAVEYKLSPMMPIVVGVIEFLLIGVLSMFQFLAYSAFYFKCKNDMVKSRGLEYCTTYNCNGC
ncbi:hypothetical protein Tco_0255647 [Tanacetum coccineum]